jgi:hypothetical protein
VQKVDVVYGEVYGTGLLMDVFSPRGKTNGLGIIDVVSGAWHSDRAKIRDHTLAQVYNIYCGRGYTVFAIRPGSRPRYTAADMAAHVKVAIRYVKQHAADYKVDPERLGLTGASAGGHLAALVAITPEPARPDSRNSPKQPASSSRQPISSIGMANLRTSTCSATCFSSTAPGPTQTLKFRNARAKFLLRAWLSPPPFPFC